ncbi:MFS general substrate transporter [Aaosphaeria arxii CBS 175.79]|uniref:MFS general substrate transporter n=1 Tax=Aaosphaeria arxii CBS 175.79 TaxID=1450172 RepID=A0A6A5XHC9_9PLEO|nr:MFS general substrate transporter [Aaosphaeria arxii CBS 175.79]KAF2012363.1 MFS general substrate transporter [Aaosphaeria arxii CBS 175.79]
MPPSDLEKSGDLEEGHTSTNLVSQELLKHSHDADAALKALEGQSIVLTPAENKRLLRKIDLHLMPIMCIVYGLNYLDKTTLSYASIMGLKLPPSSDKLHSGISINGSQYSWLSSMFYFGYLFWEYPTNRLLQRLPLGKYSAFNIIMWGTVLACFAAVDNYGGAIAIRLFLGIFEAAVTPGFALFTSQWYTRREQGTRTGIWFSFNGFAQIFGGVLAYGIAVGCRRTGTLLEPWKIVFLATGLLTAGVGAVFLWAVPDSQINCRWLTKEERILAIERIRINGQGVGNKHFKGYQMREALLDPMCWAFFFYALIASIPNGGISNFFSQLIVGFGYTPEQSLLYGTPGGAVEIVALILCAWYGDRIGRRILVSMAGLALALLGMILIVALPLSNNSGRLAGYYFTQASPTPFVALLSLISSNVAGYTKKTTVAAMYLIGYCTGNIIGPQTFRPEHAPRYVPAEITIIVCWAVALGILAFVHVYYARQNASKAAVRGGAGYVRLENQEWLDLTDRENPEFVYTL